MAGRKDPLVRLSELTARERELNEKGITVIAGIDEAGRGPLAGPVVAACVSFRPGTWIPGVDDSKRLSPARREALYDEILETSYALGIGEADVKTIERINILEATKLASLDALEALGIIPEHLFTDALTLPTDVPSTSVVRADSNIYCVAAASIVAKVTRDRIMIRLDEEYPQYGFAAHKGYGTKAHCEAILKYGPCPVHRPKFLRRLLARAREGEPEARE